VIPERLQFLVSPELPPAQLAEVFSRAGHKLFLVGGSVRDAFLERRVEDFDFATDARPDRIAELLAPWADVVYTVGATFGTVAARKNGLTVEVTTFRDEVYRDDSRKPHVSFSDDIETDLSRRDFTVNAIALSLMDMVPVDPHGGLADLAAKVLRTPLDPAISFSEDPLRMLRLFRFQATLGSNPRPGRWKRCRGWGTGSRSSPPSGSGTSCRSWSWLAPRAGPSPGSSAPGWPLTSFPSCPPWPWSRTRISGTRTSWPTPSP
jgi:hypothetical protein